MKRAVAVFVIVVAHQAFADPQSDAVALFNQASAKYDAGDYLAAAEQFVAAYELDPDPPYLFNIAQAYRFGNNCAAAADYYHRFLAAVPAPPNRDKVNGWLHEQEACAVRASHAMQVQAPTPTIAPTHHLSRRGFEVAGVVTASAGVVALAIGLGLGDRASTLASDVTRACAMPFCAWSAEQNSDKDGRRDAAIGFALDGVAAAALAGGAILYYLGHRAPAVSVTATACRPGERGAIGAWSTSW
jgi:tetratricopeptide (TPR) repeat protein